LAPSSRAASYAAFRPHTYALLIDLVLLAAAGGMLVAVWTQ